MRASAASLRFDWSLPDALATAGPPLLFAIRLWASVCLALFIAFWLELDSPYWAGGTAAIVCQPQLGASLRKGWFRIIGTIVGAVVIVVLTACFPQDRVGYLGSLALFCGLWAFAATVLCNFASYAAALAGTTAAISAGGGSLRHSPTWRPRPRADSPVRWRGRKRRTRNPSGASSCAASSRSNLQLTRRSENPATYASTR
jgi:hypothetical protein